MGQTEVQPASWHHQAARAVPPTLRVVAQAADETIEALEMPTHSFLIALQWHPELTAPTDPTQQRIFDALVAAAQKFHQFRQLDPEVGQALAEEGMEYELKKWPEY
jgi:putative glutamine amidotransferase